MSVVIRWLKLSGALMVAAAAAGCVVLPPFVAYAPRGHGGYYHGHPSHGQPPYPLPPPRYPGR